MSDYLKVPDIWPAHWPAHDPDVKRLFGLDRKAKWPADGMPTRSIQGIDCWVLSVQAARTFGRTLRARCVCPNCGKEMPIGRLAQHWRAVHM